MPVSYTHLEMHLSTQGTIFGVGGANTAKSLGYSRVVLAREMSPVSYTHLSILRAQACTKEVTA